MPSLSTDLATRFAGIALGHVTQDYPNKLDHVITGPEDVTGPRHQHPIFFGSFDWHSCVHGYWLLAALLRLHPDNDRAADIVALFDDAFVTEKVAVEVAYLARPAARGFERPYGWGWLLMLQAELVRHEGRVWGEQLAPLAVAFSDRFKTFLPKAGYPLRAGVHSNTAFALRLADDYARQCGDTELGELVRSTALHWYGQDRDCPAWEPSGDEFLSPALQEAELMRRVLDQTAFRVWFAEFLPRAAKREPAALFSPATVSDRSDGKIVHLDGLNLSRAWCWQGIAASLAPDDPVRAVALETASAHLEASIGHVAGDYMGEHWLASFALLALLPPALD